MSRHGRCVRGIAADEFVHARYTTVMDSTLNSIRLSEKCASHALFHRLNEFYRNHRRVKAYTCIDVHYRLP
jgi:hypothetical protein